MDLIDKDERYLRDLQNKSTAAAQKQQQAVVVESSELLNHIQYIPAKAIIIPTTRQISFPVILYLPFFISIMQNYEIRATYPKSSRHHCRELPSLHEKLMDSPLSPKIEECILQSISGILIVFEESQSASMQLVTKCQE